MPRISIVLPAKDEAAALALLLPALKTHQPGAEIIVVDDGSEDDTAAACRAQQVVVVSHPYSKGNGAAIKSGAKAATGDILVFMDADGQHRPEEIDNLLKPLMQGYDLVVGSRKQADQATTARGIANFIYNKLASWLTGHEILDLTSGFRAVKRNKFLKFLPLLPNGFSYPATSTMAFFRTGYSVKFVSVPFGQRNGKSHLNPFRDGTRFLLIIFRVATLYSPLKIFFPIAVIHGLLGVFYYGYTYFSAGRFTNMGVTLFLAASLIFLIGLISEQITTLLYTRIGETDDRE